MNERPYGPESLLQDILVEIRDVRADVTALREAMGVPPRGGQPPGQLISWVNGMSSPDANGFVQLEYVETVLRPKYDAQLRKLGKPALPGKYFVPEILVMNRFIPTDERTLNRIIMNTGVVDNKDGTYSFGVGGGDMRQNRASDVFKTERKLWPMAKPSVYWAFGDDYEHQTHLATSRPLDKFLAQLELRASRLVEHPGDFGGFLWLTDT